jgi:hypothetical protein
VLFIITFILRRLLTTAESNKHQNMIIIIGCSKHQEAVQRNPVNPIAAATAKIIPAYWRQPSAKIC